MFEEVVQALSHAGVDHRVLDDEWCAANERAATNDEDRDTFRRGIRGIADVEGVDPQILPRVAAAVELAGDVRLFFDRGGNYLGVSTTHVTNGFYPKGEGNAKP